MILDRSPSAKALDVLNIAILVSLGLLCLLPLWYTLCVSLSEKSAVAAGLVQLWSIGFNLNSYNQVMADDRFLHAAWVSVVRVGLATALQFFVIVLMAYPLSKTNRDFKLRNVLMWILVFSMLFNGGLIPWYQTIRGLGLLNNIWALVLGPELPVFSVILVVNFIRNLPKELEEAATIDGAGPWYVLLRVILPVSVPVMATVLLIAIVYHWNDFMNGLILMTRTEQYPLQTYIQQMVIVINPNMTTDDFKKMNEMSNQTLNAAKIFIAMLPVLPVYLFTQRYFITGITLGSVKE